MITIIQLNRLCSVKLNCKLYHIETLFQKNRLSLSPDPFLFGQNKFLFLCKVSIKDEFRYGVYFGNVDNSSLRLYPIDSGGGELMSQ